MKTIQTKRAVIVITKSCSLKCKLCISLSPYIKKYTPTFDFLKKEIDAFFSIVDKTEIATITGGEPFMCGARNNFLFGDVIQYLCEAYHDKFDRIETTTNGTIPPSDELCEVIKSVSLKKPFKIMVDNYGQHSVNVSKTIERLDHHGIDHFVRDYSGDLHCNGWIDFRDISLKRDYEEAKELYTQCAFPHKIGPWLALIDGIIAPCSIATARYLCGEIEKTSEDIVDLFGDVELMKEKMHLLLSRKKPLESCLYCNGGLCDNNHNRFIPAEQATNEEINQWRITHKMRL